MMSFYTAAAIVSALCHQSDAFKVIGSRLTRHVRTIHFPKESSSKRPPIFLQRESLLIRTMAHLKVFHSSSHFRV